MPMTREALHNAGLAAQQLYAALATDYGLPRPGLTVSVYEPFVADEEIYFTVSIDISGKGHDIEELEARLPDAQSAKLYPTRAAPAE